MRIAIWLTTELSAAVDAAPYRDPAGPPSEPEVDSFSLRSPVLQAGLPRPAAAPPGRQGGLPARLPLLSLIAAGPEGEVCACELVEPLGKSQPTVSHHLKVLYEAGLVDREKRGSWVWYRAVPGRLEALRSALTRPLEKSSGEFAVPGTAFSPNLSG